MYFNLEQAVKTFHAESITEVQTKASAAASRE
jgi:hypothetical protein